MASLAAARALRAAMRPPHRAHREIRAASCSTQAQDKASIGEDYSTLEGAWVASSVSGGRELPAWSAPFLRAATVSASGGLPRHVGGEACVLSLRSRSSALAEADVRAFKRGGRFSPPSGHRRPAFAQRNVMEYRRGRRPAYSALILAARITWPHLSVSSAMSLPKSAGEPPSAVA